MFNHLKIAGFLLFAGLIVASCASSQNPDIERGSSYQFQDGYPEVRASAIGLLNEDDEAVINITTEVVYGSLIYRTIDGQSVAQITLEIRINERDGDFSKSFREEFDIFSEDANAYMSQDLFTFIKDMEVQPGEFDIEITVSDNSSGKAILRETSAIIPDPADPIINLTSVRLSAKSMDSNRPEFTPITTYDVPARMDSLKLDFQVTNNDPDDPLTIRSRLIHFEADTMPARPLHFNNYSPSSTGYKGIDMRSPEELESTTRVLEQSGSVTIEYKYPLLSRGNYRFEVETEDEDGERLYKARDFSIKSDNYPMVQTAREMAEPLYYLMSESRYEEMMEINDPDSLKDAVDRFWLSNVGSQNRARNVISLYYERVEEANKQFSNFKEGWKTDAGMMYILFGPPWYVDRSLNRMQWSYAYDRTDPRYNFYFERPRNPNEYFPFQHYILERSTNYFNVVYQQRQLWLTGRILESRL